MVVSVIDPRQTLLQLVERKISRRRFSSGRRRARGVTAKINLALSALPAFPAVEADPMPLRGRLLIAPGLDDLERAFDAAKYGEISPDLWLELAILVIDRPWRRRAATSCRSTRTAPRDTRGGSWSEHRQALYQSVLRVLRGQAPGIDR